MSVTSGNKLGAYEIQSPLGAGGMGEVYRAHDSRLDRDVAIKILTASLASDPSSRQRLEREAKAVSELSSSYLRSTRHRSSEWHGVMECYSRFQYYAVQAQATPAACTF